MRSHDEVPEDEGLALPERALVYAMGPGDSDRVFGPQVLPSYDAIGSLSTVACGGTNLMSGYAYNLAFHVTGWALKWYRNN